MNASIQMFSYREQYIKQSRGYGINTPLSSKGKACTLKHHGEQSKMAMSRCTAIVTLLVASLPHAR